MSLDVPNTKLDGLRSCFFCKKCCLLHEEDDGAVYTIGAENERTLRCVKIFHKGAVSPPQFSADDIIKMREFFPIFHVTRPVAPSDFETFHRPCSYNTTKFNSIFYKNHWICLQGSYFHFENFLDLDFWIDMFQLELL